MTNLTRYRPSKPVIHDTQKTYPGPFAMAEPGSSLRCFEEVDKQGAVGSNEEEPVMKGGLSCVALAFGLLTETLFALGQTTNATSVAQGPSSPPPSGVLVTPPPAPVLVPPSGVLPTFERPAVTARPLKMAQQIHLAKSSTPVSVRRHTVISRPTYRRRTITRPTTVAQRMAPTLTVVSVAYEEPRHDETGFESFLSQLGKAKEAK
jgi:hypothetical protein